MKREIVTTTLINIIGTTRLSIHLSPCLVPFPGPLISVAYILIYWWCLFCFELISSLWAKTQVWFWESLASGTSPSDQCGGDWCRFYSACLGTQWSESVWQKSNKQWQIKIVGTLYMWAPWAAQHKSKCGSIQTGKHYHMLHHTLHWLPMAWWASAACAATTLGSWKWEWDVCEKMHSTSILYSLVLHMLFGICVSQNTASCLQAAT